MGSARQASALCIASDCSLPARLRPSRLQDTNDNLLHSHPSCRLPNLVIFVHTYRPQQTSPIDLKPAIRLCCKRLGDARLSVGNFQRGFYERFPVASFSGRGDLVAGALVLPLRGGLGQMMGERGVSVGHSTIYHWMQKYASEIEKRLRRHRRRPRSTSWRG